jgi:nucleotide-binding universal stress UspA family protein
VQLHHVGRSFRALTAFEDMRILAATDGSRGSSAALRFAARLVARDPKSELVILTVSRPVAETPPEKGTPSDGMRRRAEKILEAAARQMRGQPVQVQYRFVSARPSSAVPETISREADRLKADLVVIGSEGRDTLNEWVLGGTALRLVYVSRRPVTVVRPPRRRKTA